MRHTGLIFRPATIAACIALIGVAGADDKDQKPAKPPKGAIVLFDGKSLAAWKHRKDGQDAQWTVTDGYCEVKPGAGDILTRQEFRDYQLHVEFATPLLPDKKSQERGNSGCYQHGRYEIQILDSYNNETYKAGGCGSIYGQKDPDQNVCKPPLEWQSYDITFRAPRLDDAGKVVERPRITVVWNGVKVHDNVEITLDNTTSGLGGVVPKAGPILLQDHGNRIRFRNIWIKPIKPS
jgi:hypothetical protein